MVVNQEDIHDVCEMQSEDDPGMITPALVATCTGAVYVARARAVLQRNAPGSSC